MTGKTDGELLSSPWISNGFDGVVGSLVHPPSFPLSKWPEFEGAAEATAAAVPWGPLQSTTTTRGNHRFGSLSYSSFFSRHNPHPVRVTHLKGLLDIPVCVVNDDGYLANPRYALRLPPNDFVRTINRRETGYRRKTSAGLGLITPNTANERQSKYTRNQHGNAAWRNKHFIPDNGAEAWRDELKTLTDALMKTPDDDEEVFFSQQQQQQQQHLNGIAPQTKKRSTQYSAETGRIVPSSSKLLSSRGRGRLSSRRQNMKSSSSEQLGQIIEQSSSEVLVLQLLCQILETEDVNDVQKWLTTAPDRERSFAFDLLKTALSQSDSEEQLIDQHSFHLMPSLPEEHDVQLTDELPPVNSNLDSVNKVDRLIIDHESDEQNKNVSRLRGQAEEEQYKTQENNGSRPIQLQCKMSNANKAKKNSSNRPTTTSRQNGLQKNNNSASKCSKIESTRLSALKEKETENIVSVSEMERGRVVHQSQNGSTHEPGDPTKAECKPTIRRSLTII